MTLVTASGEPIPTRAGDGGRADGAARRADARYRLQLADGDVAIADAVVLAAPAFAAGDLLAGMAPAVAADLTSIPYVTTATVSLAYRNADVAAPLDGFGFVVPRAEQRDIMAGTFSSSKFPGRAPAGHALVRAFVGRAGRERPARLDDRELLQLVRAELAHIVALEAEPLFTRIFRWPDGMPQYRVGHAELVDGVRREIAALPGIEIAGGYLNGIGIGDCIREGSAAAARALAHAEHLASPRQPLRDDDLPAADGVVD